MTDLRRLDPGVPGLSSVLDGGFVPERAYMLRGGAGTGKTVLGLQFLAAGEGSSLFVGFEEPTENIRENAATLGVDTDDLSFLDLSPDGDAFAADASYDVFGADEVEGDDITARIREAVEANDPDRVFVDPMTQLRHYVRDDYQFRRQVSSFMRYLTGRGATVLFSTQPTGSVSDEDLEFICDGTITLAHAEKGRTLEVTKFRGSSFASGVHTARVRDGGVHVYPRLVPGDHDAEFTAEAVSSGVDALDDLLHGGIDRGTVSVLSGPSGVGKTTTATHFLVEAAARGERSVAYLFEERAATHAHRSEVIGLPVRELRERGTLDVREVEPLGVSPDEFAADVREAVEEDGARTVLIDGVSGYRLSLRGDDDDLVRELHALCRYLRNMGVAVILVDDVGSVTGDFEATSDRISYLADTIVFLRYLELTGELRKAVGVLKKRTSDFERTLREFRITDDGLVLGEPMTRLRGVLSGSPELVDD
ncbi:ATPase domain-containing protein [Halobaculum gomorrense]|uniref:non-specific serine/threonine protein kinase n=1 Tax=Halobaculum gomorrense TaxID=43928 RepID=A0A1M5K1M4_9EURY|nr:ATPase domain-containing protein [Halobaculum gomorrense]SHG46651.1 circadian clock protein KaiC [Halobaculum gomorrense]